MSDLFYDGDDTIYHLSTGTAAMAGSMLTPYVNAQASGTGTADDALEQFYDDIFESSYGEQFDPVRERAIAGTREIIGDSSNSWTRNLAKTGEIDTDNFLLLKSNGIVQVNSSSSNRPLVSTSNSYYSTGNGEHVFVYDGNGKLIYDISSARVKSFKINVDPNGIEHYQPYKLKGSVPAEFKKIFGG